jgi:hypothetical protein
MSAASLLFAILFILSRAIGPCPAETLVSTDFARGAAGWALNHDARLLTIAGRQMLTLTQNEAGQTGVAWTELKRRVPSFSFSADLRVRFYPQFPGDCPADGLTLVFARAETDTVGSGGGSLGLHSGPDTFTCFEINTFGPQGLEGEKRGLDCLSGKHVTFAFDWIDPRTEIAQRLVRQNGTPEKGGAKIGQVLPPPGMTIVNGGWYRYQWNADGATNTMTVYVTGLEARNKQFRNVEVLKVKFARSPIDFAGRFGLTATTGGYMQHVDVAAVRIDAPMIAPP